MTYNLVSDEKGQVLRLISLVLVLCLIGRPAVAESLADNSRIQPPGVADTLTPGAKEAADLIGVTPLVDRVLVLKKQGLTSSTARQMIILKLMLYKRLWAASLDVRKAADRIDKELAHAYDIRDILEGRRGRMINLTNTSNFIQGGTLGSIRTGILMNGRVALETLNTSNYIRIVTGRHAEHSWRGRA